MAQVTPEIQQRVQELRQLVQSASYAYYVLDNPIMEDAVYDKLYRELQDLETQHPELVTPDSPTQRVGEKPASQFSSVRHNIPLYSLENAFNIEEFTKWQERWQRYALSLTPPTPLGKGEARKASVSDIKGIDITFRENLDSSTQRLSPYYLPNSLVKQP